MSKIVIITDLDGTLLDSQSYSFEAGLPALQLIRERQIPLVACSSKTRAEIEYYRERFGNSDPFISENGGALFVPGGYFEWNALPAPVVEEQDQKYRIVRLGAKYADLRRVVSELQDEGFGIWGFGDMSPEEIALLTGLPENEAIMAQKREFDEPFLFNGDDAAREKLIRAVKEKGFNITRGLFYHILGRSDKGKAVRILIEMYRNKFGNIRTIALGDSPNDLPMLKSVDQPVVVEKKSGGYDRCFADEGFKQAKGIGPEGWNAAIMELLVRMDRLP